MALSYQTWTTASVYWGASSNCVIKPLQSLQNKIIKSIFSPDTNICTILDYHIGSLLQLDDLYHASICKFVFKFLEWTDDTFRRSPSPYQTRQNSAHHLNVPFTTSAQTFKSIKNSGPRLYNRLPTYIKERPTYICFKFSLKKYILSHFHLIPV